MVEKTRVGRIAVRGACVFVAVCTCAVIWRLVLSAPGTAGAETEPVEVEAETSPAATPLTSPPASEMDHSGADLLDALRLGAEEISELSGEERGAAAQDAWRQLERRFPLPADWMLQDAFDEPLWAHVPAGGREDWRPQRILIGDKLASLFTDRNTDRWGRMIERVLDELGEDGAALAREWAERDEDAGETALADLYLRACEARRVHRLAPMMEQDWEGLVFARHYNIGGSHYAYTEGLSDAQNERHFRPGASLNLLRMDGTVETLLDDPDGVIRDVDVSWDGSTILFSWKQSDREDDYSLYVMDVASREITAITDALGHADYEGAFLPNGDIVFNSTRCVQIVDCWWTEVSNLYTCSPDGRHLRRLSFDQVHTNYPAVTQGGRVLYTRWDYNDRGQLYPQALFQMNPDGTAQQEFYGNISWFPTTILHARGIPDTQKVLAVFTGHHSWQAGKLGVLDPSRGRQENEGAQLVAPVRETPAERIDFYGQEGDVFMYPWPIDDQHFLVSYAPRGWEGNGRRGDHDTVFGIYFMDMDGRRELLDRDDEGRVSAGRMVPLTARSRPHVRPSTVDYREDTGVYYVQDVYEGAGLEGVERGTIQALRVVGLEFRAAGVGENRNAGPAGSALVSTPISINGGWDVKRIIGEAEVHEDGSALFEAPARTPLYFQAIDGEGRVAQSMRSWSTLQPGERLSCIGCHSENKHDAPPVHAPTSTTRAMEAGVQALEPFYGPPRGFSYREEIQPILDNHCISCHDGSMRDDEPQPPFPLLGTPVRDEVAKREWSESYINLLNAEQHGAYTADSNGPIVKWINPQSGPEMLPPYHTGSAQSPLIAMLQEGHQDVELSQEEMDKLAAWIDLAVPYAGDYTEANAWSDEEMDKYNRFLEKRRAMEAVERENIREFVREQH
ncbi:MAG: hypothetical protein R6W89_00830 [Candidatus Hydrogenedentota bacterium]